MNTETLPAPESDATAVPIPKKKGFLEKLGAGSLVVSLFFHGALVAIGIFIVVATIPPEKEKLVDFKATGGGGGSPANSNAQKKTQVNMSKQMLNRVAAANSVGTFTLPEPTSANTMSSLGSLSSAGTGGLGGGSGGGSGSGTGIGTGAGPGGMGVGPAGGKGLMIFGTPINVRSIGVVMDVSGSMTPHLPKVLDELDRVAKGSPVILHVGCVISVDKTRPKINAVLTPMKTNSEEAFKLFWCLYQDPSYRQDGNYLRDKVDLSRPMPLPQIYEQFAKRPGTFYNDVDGLKTTANAILSKEFEKVEAIYWFADFQDKIDDEAAKDVLRTLKRRKQKLYIHASQQGKFIASARDLIAIPSGGKEIVVTPDPPKKAK